MLFPRSFFLLAAALLLASHSAEAAGRYGVIPIPVPSAPGDYIAGTGLNASGQIVGTREASSDDSTISFLWQAGVVTLFGPIASYTYTSFGAINDQGVIAGWSNVGVSGGQTYLFVLQNGVMTSLGVKLFPTAINSAGQIVGHTLDAQQDSHAALYSGGVLIDLETLGGLNSGATGLNTSGEIVGWSDTFDNAYDTGAGAGFIYTKGKMTPLSGPKGADAFSSIGGINQAGQVVGSVLIKSQETHAVVYERGKITDLGTLGGANSTAVDINDSGQILGESALRKGTTYPAFLYSHGKMVALSSLLAHPADWQIDGVTRINDSGLILASGTPAGGDEDQIVLIVPPPSVSLPGGKNITTRHARFVLRGTSYGTTSVACRTTAGGAFQPVEGIATWHVSVALRHGRNEITLLARGPLGQSHPLRMTITRK